MIDFLIINGISMGTIKQLEERPSDLFDLNCNKEEFAKIVSFLKLIGIKNIDELLLVNTNLFLNTKLEVSHLFSRKDIQKIVQEINENSQNIFNLYE